MIWSTLLERRRADAQIRFFDSCEALRAAYAIVLPGFNGDQCADLGHVSEETYGQQFTNATHRLCPWSPQMLFPFFAHVVNEHIDPQTTVAQMRFH